MTDEIVHKLDTEALDLFARKGTQAGPRVPQAGRSNGVKVRRIIQVTGDLSPQPFAKLRILDLGCGEGVYAIEAGLREANVIALDARTQRMEQGAACAKRHGLDNVRFIQADVRAVTRQAFGSFDVVYLLGLLYHLDTPDVFRVLESVFEVCTHMLLVDTLISLTVESQVEWHGQTYRGRRCREHGDDDTDAARRSRALKSIDNTFSFRLTRESLMGVLHDVGFTSVYECHVPLEPDRAEDRVTVVALKGTPVLVSTYPWVNHKSESEIERILQHESRGGGNEGALA